MKTPPRIFTIGHSTRSIDDFINILKAYQIEKVIDIRTIPRSRHNPQFNSEVLPESLRKAGIGYIHTKGLGGLRHAAKDSPNTGWRNASFRGFADYMQTNQFEENLKMLIKLAGNGRVALMCAEAVPWRCHRSLIADALTVKGIEVEHILSITSHRAHSMTSFAKVESAVITYPSDEQRQE